MPRSLVPLLLTLVLLVGCVPQPPPPRESTKPTLPPATAPSLPATPTQSSPVVLSPAELRATRIAGLPSLPPLPPSRPLMLPPVQLPDIPAQLPAGFVVVPAGFSQLRPPPPPSPPSPSSQPQAYAADLSDVALTVLLSDQQRSALAANGFVVSPGAGREFYEVYEDVRYNYQPVFVSSDAVLHTYHLVFNNVLRRTEQETLAPLIARMDWQLLQTSLQYAEVLAGTPFAEAARRNAASFAVPVALLTPGWQPPAAIADLVNADLQLIAAHSGISPSAVTGVREDWTQYTVRGHYTINDALSRYFQAMMWHGRATLELSVSGTAASDDLVARQMLLLTHALRYTDVNGVPAADLWQTVYDVTAFFVGESADLNPPLLFQLLQQSYGDVGDVRQLEDAQRIAHFVSGVRLLTPPDEAPQLRLMGQRVVPDTDVFRALLDPQVPARTLPRGLDVLAALGSERALTHLQTAGETGYPNYLSQLAAQRQRLAGWTEDAWTQTLYRHWLYALLPLLELPPGAAPQFMQSPAWLDKQLTTALASWTELKHDTVLYAQQVFVEAGWGEWLFPPTPELPPGYVEPLPLLYARVNALAARTLDGLQQRGMLPEGADSMLGGLLELTQQLQRMAEAELNGQALSSDDHTYLRKIGVTLERIALASQSDTGFAGTGQEGEPPDVALVTDVASNAAGGVLHEALGPISEIYAIVPIDGRFLVTRGAVFSHYEFEVAANRLTNEQWRALVDTGGLPPLAPWTASYVVAQRVDDALAERVIAFNDDLVAAVFFTQPQGEYLVYEDTGPVFRDYNLREHLIGAELDETLRYIAELQQRAQIVGMKRIALAFVAFQLAGENAASVTTRETWEEALYPRPAEDAQQLPPPIGRRSYTVEATYTLERQNGSWLISRVTLTPEPPAWAAP